MPGARLNLTLIMMQNAAERCLQKFGATTRLAFPFWEKSAFNGHSKNGTRRPDAYQDTAPIPAMTISPPSGGLNMNQACLVYQSALIGVKLAHFSGKSSSAKIAVTGQTGTQAPQSMHSTGLM
jgi:hypothetical protein